MLQLQAPFRMGMKRVPVVRFAAELLERFGKAGAGVYRLCANRIRCGLVDGHRVPRCEHAHVGHDGCVVFGEAIAAGRDIGRDAHEEAALRLGGHHGRGLFGHAQLQVVAAIVLNRENGHHRAHRVKHPQASASVIVHALSIWEWVMFGTC